MQVDKILTASINSSNLELFGAWILNIFKNICSLFKENLIIWSLHCE